MRSLIPILLALACPIGMCLIPMLLMRRRGEQAGCHDSASGTQESELAQLREEVARLRAERLTEDSAIR